MTINNNTNNEDLLLCFYLLFSLGVARVRTLSDNNQAIRLN